MIQPKPYKLKCPKCGYSKVVAPKSDVVDLRDSFVICPKCNEMMERKELSALDNILNIFK